MQRLFNINKWSTLAEGDALDFKGRKPRVVRLEVNAPSKVQLWISQADVSPDEPGVEHHSADAELVFLALVEGRDTLEFHVTGKFSLHCQGGDCDIYTADGEGTALVVSDPVIYTRISERRQRSPELEYIAAVMSRNMERRLDQQAEELRRQFSREPRSAGLQGRPGREPVQDGSPRDEPSARSAGKAKPATKGAAAAGGSDGA